MTDRLGDPLVIALFCEIVMVETLAKTRLTRVLPRGMELSHFMVLNHFARLGGEKTPAQLARVFHVTKGAMSNTVARQHPRQPGLGQGLDHDDLAEERDHQRVARPVGHRPGGRS